MRTNKYQKDTALEEALTLLNQKLSEVEQELISNVKSEELPTVFIVGAQRSGTTLLMQLLIKNYDFCYINNFISRFWKSPYLGSLMFKSFDSITEDSSDNWFSSDLGYTKGIHGPHEFGYFWKNYFPENVYEQDIHISDGLKQTISAIQSVEGKPFLVKNLTICSFHIKKIKELLPNSFFIFLERDPKMVIQSTYQSRLKLFGNENEWFGLKPKQYLEIKDLPVFEQIALQIKYTTQHIEDELSLIPEDSYCKMSYEDLITNTDDVFEKLNAKLNAICIKSNRDSLTHPEFRVNNELTLDKDKKSKLENAYTKYFEDN